MFPFSNCVYIVVKGTHLIFKCCCFSSDYSSAFCDSPLLQHFHWHHPHASKNMLIVLLNCYSLTSVSEPVLFPELVFSNNWPSFSLTSSSLTALLTPLIDSGWLCLRYHTDQGGACMSSVKQLRFMVKKLKCVRPRSETHKDFFFLKFFTFLYLKSRHL